jgi:hypothetical protein
MNGFIEYIHCFPTPYPQYRFFLSLPVEGGEGVGLFRGETGILIIL